MIAASGCADRSAPFEGGVFLDFDRKDPKPFVEFYFSPFTEGTADVFESGLIVESDGRFFLNPERLEPHFASQLEEDGSDGTLDWDELKPFFARHYYDLIDAPPTLAALLEEDTLSTDGWLEIEVVGVMTTARRHVLFPSSAVRTGLESYRENGDRLLYPTGTTIIADHTFEQLPVETTAMRKRADGHWDFFVFDAEGTLAPKTDTPPKSLSVPTQCTGCHLGSRLFEPEKSFPAAAPDGPDGPLEIFVGDDFRNAEMVVYLDEHRKRSDGILGLYGTIYLSQLLTSRDSGTIAPDDAALLDQLGL